MNFSNPSPLARWIHHHANLEQQEPTLGLTSASETVDLSLESLSYHYRAEYARRYFQRRKLSDLAQEKLELAIKRIERSRRTTFEKLNANRDGKRGDVFTFGKLVDIRSKEWDVPRIVARRNTSKKIHEMYTVCNALSESGIRIAPQGKISSTMLISVYLGDNLMQKIGEHPERSQLEQKLWGELWELTHELAQGVLRSTRLTGTFIETAEFMHRSIFPVAGFLSFRDQTTLYKEIATNILYATADECWPFIDPSWRNFGIDGSMQEYLNGDAAVWAYDPDRYTCPSGRNYNLSHLIFQDWQHIPLETRLANMDEQFAHCAFRYLTLRTCRAIQYGTPSTDAVDQEREVQQLKLEHVALRDLATLFPELKSTYPVTWAVIDTVSSSHR